MSAAAASARVPARLASDAHLLVVIVARIGDTLLVTPMLRALKEACPDGSLTVLAHAKRRTVLEHVPFIDQLGDISPRHAALRGWFGAERYECAFVFGRDAALVRYALRVARHVIAFDGALDSELQNARLQTVPAPRSAMHAVHERLLLASAAGVTARHLRLCYRVTDEEKRWALQWLEANVPAPDGPLIGLQMLSFRTKAHRNWPPESFAELVSRVLVSHPAARFIVLGDRDALDAAKTVRTRAPQSVIVAAGALTLRQSAALIARLDLYIGVDTGPTHIAGALDVPMVALYHRDYPGRNLAPLERDRCRVLEQAPQGDITVDEVLHAAESLLAETRPS